MVRLRSAWRCSSLDIVEQFRTTVRRRLFAAESAWTDSSPSKDKRYVDRMVVSVRAGRGGHGCVSFLRSRAKGGIFKIAKAASRIRRSKCFFTKSPRTCDAGRGGRPDGGHGGKGGDVILQASRNIKSLGGISQLLKAQNGEAGSSSRQNGRNGRDLVIQVPLGTMISQIIDSDAQEIEDNPNTLSHTSRTAEGEDAEDEEGNDAGVESINEPEWLRFWRRPWIGARDYRSDSDEDDSRVERSYRTVADLVHHGQQVVVAAGGQGGRGNTGLGWKARPGVSPAPNSIHSGRSGDRAKLLLELKLLADVAFVGLPNVGKSSLLRALSSATPRVGSYAFTTLTPQLGTVQLSSGDRVVVADVPGLLKGAHANVGLGHRFLRHIERASVLAVVVSAKPSERDTRPTENMENPSVLFHGRDGVDVFGRGRLQPSKPKSHRIWNDPIPSPWEQIETIRSELAMYSSSLVDRPWFVIVNKIDLLQRPKTTLNALRRRLNDVPVVGVSATGGVRLEEISLPARTSLWERGASLNGNMHAVKPRGIEEVLEVIEAYFPLVASSRPLPL